MLPQYIYCMYMSRSMEKLGYYNGVGPSYSIVLVLYNTLETTLVLILEVTFHPKKVTSKKNRHERGINHEKKRQKKRRTSAYTPTGSHVRSSEVNQTIYFAQSSR